MSQDVPEEERGSRTSKVLETCRLGQGNFVPEVPGRVAKAVLGGQFTKNGDSRRTSQKMGCRNRAERETLPPGSKIQSAFCALQSQPRHVLIGGEWEMEFQLVWVCSVSSLHITWKLEKSWNGLGSSAIFLATKFYHWACQWNHGQGCTLPAGAEGQFRPQAPHGSQSPTQGARFQAPKEDAHVFTIHWHSHRMQNWIRTAVVPSCKRPKEEWSRLVVEFSWPGERSWTAASKMLASLALWQDATYTSAHRVEIQNWRFWCSGRGVGMVHQVPPHSHFGSERARRVWEDGPVRRVDGGSWLFLLLGQAWCGEAMPFSLHYIFISRWRLFEGSERGRLQELVGQHGLQICCVPSFRWHVAAWHAMLHDKLGQSGVLASRSQSLRACQRH